MLGGGSKMTERYYVILIAMISSLLEKIYHWISWGEMPLSVVFAYLSGVKVPARLHPERIRFIDSQQVVSFFF